uniref:type I restriction endonuclease n=1 Tax=Helicobacter pylori TaxID=210 RepID=UPI002159DFE2|nr:type I restriction endonuclease [Helicobacter pylori]
MIFKKAIIAYLPHKRTENAWNKKIIFFAIMKPFKGQADNANQNKKGAYHHGKQPNDKQ